ncbi:uncharacterized protein Tco025E_00788 [Trypanosoma conorhini]|uniref:PX domain-containing protein n=1 Tax=Trypanosoma conorhini TaxID=83891 RepID=A0A422QAI0_9TRYP|nr:uncharacterized protein Tco025E_00788 [Trypanosoma conorhini]RNF26983.1 hypothetical protein Tco025E_00788 [Trypanosoma conorhini]
MSKWSSLREGSDGFDDVNEGSGMLSSCGYIVHIPPPMSGPSLPASATDIAAVTLPSVRVAPDVTQRAVTWYEVLVRSTTHQWSVMKRFSEFFDLYRAMEKMSLVQLAKRQLERTFSSPPSRLFPTHRRQQQLEEFVQSLLQTLKDLSVRYLCAAGPEPEGSASRPPTSAVTRAAFATFVRFLTTTSYDASLDGALAEAGGGVTAPVVDKAAAADCLITDERTHLPPAKIMHAPKQLFIIMLQLPGACMSTVFVKSSDDSREIVVGGSWNADITGPDSVYVETPESPQGDVSPPSSDGAVEGGETPRAAGAPSSTKVLVDTFPMGEFQMEFEVPPPFAVDEWRSQYKGGILFLSWHYFSPTVAPSTESA